MPKLGKYEVLSEKEVKEFHSRLRLQFGIEAKFDFVLLKRKNRILIANKEILKNKKLFKLNVQRAGLYIAKVDEKSIKLSIEGSQIFGKYAKKNIVELNEEEFKKWMQGLDIRKSLAKGVYIVKYKEHYLGTTTSDGKRLMNRVPKERRFSLSES